MLTHPQQTQHNQAQSLRLVSSWNRLDNWLGLGKVASMRWARRLPAVVIAGTLLSFFVWSAGIQEEDLVFVPFLSLLGFGLILKMVNSKKV